MMNDLEKRRFLILGSGTIHSLPNIVFNRTFQGGRSTRNWSVMAGSNVEFVIVL